MAPSHGPRARRGADRHPFTPRGWLVVAGGALTGAVILAAWLPVGALLSQRAQLDADASRIGQLTLEQRTLLAEQRRLSSPAVVDQLAREQYQLVLPGQRLIQVLSPSFTPSGRSDGAPFPGDPGDAPLSQPDGVPGLATGAGGTALTGSPVGASSSGTAAEGATTTSRAAASPGFVSRVLGTLEFWR